MKKLLKHKKALSPVVAAIILIAVTVAVSIAVAAWMGALTIGFMATEEVKITGVSFDPSGSPVTITVQNTGSTTVVLTDVRITGHETTSLGEVPLAAGNKVDVDWSGTGLVAGNSYNVEVVTKKGNVFTYRATYPL